MPVIPRWLHPEDGHIIRLALSIVCDEGKRCIEIRSDPNTSLPRSGPPPRARLEGHEPGSRYARFGDDDLRPGSSSHALASFQSRITVSTDTCRYAAMFLFYNRVGQNAGHACETAAAVEAGNAVRSEVRHQRPRGRSVT